MRPAAVLGLQIGGRGQKHFCFDRLGQNRPRAIAQNLDQLFDQNPSLNQVVDDVIVGHGMSLLGGEVDTRTPL